MTLRDEILARQDCADAVAVRDLDAIAALMSAGRTKVQRVAIEDVQAHLQSSLVWWDIKRAAGNPDHPANAAAVAVIDVASARYARLDMALPAIGGMLGGLVATGVMPQAEMDALIGMSNVPDPVSRTEVEAALFNADGSLK
ncbi:MAG: hypothetical protein JWQ03_3167 [Variovorax sp.]|nr:hypothetical protein [Variovorax sp.]